MTHVNTAAAEGRSQELTTPRSLFLQLHAEFHFDRDVAASRENALLPAYWSVDDDALTQDWTGVVFCNPPYSRCDAFVRKAAHEATKGATVVMLVPVRADTGWWHEVALPRAEIRWIRGRLRFGRPATRSESRGWTTAPFASCLLIFRPRRAGLADVTLDLDEAAAPRPKWNESRPTAREGTR